MTDPTELPEGHEWNKAVKTDRLHFHCPNCDIHVPVIAGDTQAGIGLFCPTCDGEMECRFEWKVTDE